MLSTPPATMTSPMPDMICCGGDRNGLQPAGAEAIDRLARHAERKPGTKRSDAPYVKALFCLRQRATERHVLHLLRINARSLDCSPDRGRCQIVRARGAQAAARRFADGGASGGDDDGISHDVLL